DQAELEVAREGFRTYSTTVEVTPGAPHTITAELPPESKEAQAILNEERQGSLENQATEQYLEDAARAYDEYPILEQLPKHASLYSAYQGLAETSGYEFAIHLYLYKGHESQGRQAFQDWLEDQDYHLEDYEVVEHIENEEPPSATLKEPSWDQLTHLRPSVIELPNDPSGEGLPAEGVPVLFAEIPTTWEAPEDVHSTAGLQRARALI